MLIIFSGASFINLSGKQMRIILILGVTRIKNPLWGEIKQEEKKNKKKSIKIRGERERNGET